MTAAPDVAVRSRRFTIPHGPLDLVSTTFALRQGIDDPTTRVVNGEVWRTMRIPGAGPATLHLRRDGDELVADAVGPAADAALDLAPRLAGLDDDPGVLKPLHPAVAEARRRRPGLRMSSGTPVVDVLIWAVLAQRVVGEDARRAYRDLVVRLGERAPGGGGLLLPPDPARVARTPYWTFHECNVERRKAMIVLNAALRATTLNALANVPAAEARRKLMTLTGVGAWTAAVVTAASHGDPDAVPVGDYHIPDVVAYALAGEPRADDARMLELLEPYAGQRGRVVRLLMSGGRGAPRYGPKARRQDMRGR